MDSLLNYLGSDITHVWIVGVGIAIAILPYNKRLFGQDANMYLVAIGVALIWPIFALFAAKEIVGEYLWAWIEFLSKGRYRSEKSWRNINRVDRDN
ncbi:MAG: hypothetical protein HY938_04900 [Nitrosomonadales bacterium]|nr:hypothetical protein [Nitrosomonadales bacterium]